MVTPSCLAPGDTVGIAAPARKISPAEIAPALKLIESWGLKTVFGKNIFGEHHQFSGTDSQRAADLQQMLDDPSVKAVFCARGGYGTLRLIDSLDFRKFQSKPKWIVGYSDITVLHAHIHACFGIETIHAAMPFNLTKNTEAAESLRKALFGEPVSYMLTAQNAAPMKYNRRGSAEGVLTGGNLSLLYALSSSLSESSYETKILFIEDIDEYLYHIDRMMVSLKRPGKLAGLAGLIIGSMTDMKDNTVPFGKTAEEIIREAVDEYNYPVCFGFPAGHVDRNLALILGRKVRLSVGDEMKLQFSDGNPL
jgi:muramoyltetrapeptide carboxypeptidase